MIATNPRVERLMLAISEHEGWEPSGSEAHPEGTVAYRNHNPGNLRYSPFQYKVVGGYAVFRNDYVGWMALYWDLWKKSLGETATNLKPTSTLRDLIFTYAPPKDNNDSEKYLQAVVARTGIKETETLQEIFAN